MSTRGRAPKYSKVERTCATCGVSWMQYPYQISRSKYCSRSCWAKSRIGNATHRVKPEYRPYAHCGVVAAFGGYGNKAKNSRFCSVQCAIDGRWVGMPGHQRPRTMTNEEAAWFGGLFDGEGNICWPRRTHLRSFRLSMTNTSMELLERVAAVTGTGKIFDRSRFRKSARHSPVWVWACQGENARQLLAQFEVWLIVKREAADVALGRTPATLPPLTQRSRTALAAA